MATSGEYFFNPDLAMGIDEAFERIKVDPASLEPRHIDGARRSINYMLIQWATLDQQDYRIERITQALVQGTQQYTIDPGTDGRVVDVNQVSLRRQGIDTSIYQMPRQEWLDIPDKDVQGRPSRYFTDKQVGSLTIDLWTVPENSTDVLVMDVMRKHQDIGELNDEPDIHYFMQEAFVASLAAKLNVKFGDDNRQGYLDLAATSAFKEGNGASKEQGDVVIVPASSARLRGGGRIR